MALEYLKSKIIGPMDWPVFEKGEGRGSMVPVECHIQTDSNGFRVYDREGGTLCSLARERKWRKCDILHSTSYAEET